MTITEDGSTTIAERKTHALVDGPVHVFMAKTVEEVGL